MCTYAGDVLCRTARIPDADQNFPLVFAVGFFAITLGLFVLSLLVPVGLVADAGIITGAVILLRMRAAGTAWVADARRQVRPDLLATAFCIVAATLWAQDCIRPFERGVDTVVVKPWLDADWHACQIRIFAQSHGAATLQDLRMAGHAPAIYHYAPYMLPALLNASTGVSAFLAYTAFMVPAGLLLTGMAAFTLGTRLTGPWGGLAAAVALLALPDARWHGLSIGYFSYHWLQQIASAGAYGTSLLAIAWALVYQACLERRPGLLVAGWIAGICVLACKAQIAIAGAPLLWLFPPFAFAGISVRKRLLWATGAVIVMGAALLAYAQLSAGPTLRLDFSGIGSYSYLLHHQVERAPIQRLLSWGGDSASALCKTVWLTLVVFLGTFGMFAVLCPLVLWAGRRNFTVPWLLFPAAVAGNYLIMAVGLAPDAGGQGGPDELVHRPFVWAYFVAVVWTGAILGHAAYAQLGRRTGWAAIAVMSALFAGLTVPWMLGRGAQVGPGWGKDFAWQKVSRGLIDCAAYVRTHAPLNAWMQASGNDRFFRLSALAERQEWAVDHPLGRPPKGLEARLARLKEFRQMHGAEEIQAFAAENQISWYVLEPGDEVLWPSSITEHPVFAAHGFRVFAFPQPKVH